MQPKSQFPVESYFTWLMLNAERKPFAAVLLLNVKCNAAVYGSVRNMERTRIAQIDVISIAFNRIITMCNRNIALANDMSSIYVRI